ncbi:LysR family transcriptional regulator [Falsiroseomonas sp. CW058]|uniref:LysR family transcriptional regulator n=1 Tax=Falsiroseomonas sp. CW058 TaxID=3388664 RepID=UPI003D322174
MPDLDTTLLRSFVALAETLSFSRTAERVGRAQSAVSVQIQKLEAILGCALFERDKRNVRLTREGEALLGDARRMIALAEGMVARGRGVDVEGEVRFGSPEDFATHYLPEILAAFAAKHPRVRLHVNCDLTLRLVEGFGRGEFDLIVVKQDPAEPYPGARRLWRERPVWVAQDGAGWAGGGRAPADPTPLPLVLSPAPCVYRRRAVSALDAAGLPWDIAYTSPSFAGTVAAVRAGLGVTVLPRRMVPEALQVLDDGAGWPSLPEVEIALLAAPRPPAAAAALAEFIADRAPIYRQNR